MSLLHVLGFGLKAGHVLLLICCWLTSVIPMKNWVADSGVMDGKPNIVSDGGKVLCDWWKSFMKTCKIHKLKPYFEPKKLVRQPWWKYLWIAWVIFWVIICLSIFWFMHLYASERRKEGLGSMCDERARMLQDQFNVSMNHIQAMSILISTFHHGKHPSAIDQVKRIQLCVFFLMILS